MRIKWLNTKQKAAGMKSLAKRVEAVHTRAWASTVAKAGDNTVKDIARVDTGKMKGSTGAQIGKASGTVMAMAGYGITTPEPFYTKYQEFGTSHGIKAMNSVLAAETTMQATGYNAGDLMLKKIAVEWNNI